MSNTVSFTGALCAMCFVVAAHAEPAARSEAFNLALSPFPQGCSRAAFRTDGTFVAAWCAGTAQGDVDIAAQIYRADGTAARPLTIQVNQQTAANQISPSLGTDSEGNFVIAWTGEDPDNQAHLDIRARRFDPLGNPLGDEFVVNELSVDDNWSSAGGHAPEVAMAPDGRFVIVWYRESGTQGSTDARLFNASGQPRGGEFAVAQAFWAMDPHVAMRRDGSFIIVFADVYGEPTSDETSVFALGFNTDGGSHFARTLISGEPGPAQDDAFPEIAIEDDGDFQVAWHRAARVSLPWVNDVMLRRFDAAGVPRNDPVKVNTRDWVDPPSLTLGVDQRGAATVSWSDGDGDGLTLLARSFDRFGNVDGEPYVVASFTPSDDPQKYYMDAGSVAFDGAGNFLVTWSRGSRASGGPVYGRLYGPPTEGQAPEPPPPPQDPPPPPQDPPPPPQDPPPTPPDFQPAPALNTPAEKLDGNNDVGAMSPWVLMLLLTAAAGWRSRRARSATRQHS